jgi:hypothetical protein
MSRIMLSAASAAIALLCLPSVAFADGCSGIATFDYASTFDDIFKNSLKFQHPGTSDCISGYSATDAATYNKKVDGALYQSGGLLVFDTDGGSGTRSELRGRGIPTTDEATYTLSATARIAVDPSNRQFTIGQLFAANGSGGKPLVRIEIQNGQVAAVIYPNLSDSSPTYYRPGSSSSDPARVVTNGEDISYVIRQKRKTSTSIELFVSIEGVQVFNATVANAGQGSNNYFKIGCYMNSSTQANGCQSQFSSASVSPDLY